MKNKTILLIFLTTTFSKLFSQTSISTIIVDSGAKYFNNIEYNTGEVYVIFNIEDEIIVSKTVDKNNSFVSNESSKRIFVFPNPVIDVLKISTSKDVRISEIFLYNMDGKNILKTEIINNQIDISFLPSGTYILKTNLSNTETFKVIKR